MRRRRGRSYTDLILSMPGLVAYWRLNERAGTVARDSWGANHLTLVNAPSLGVAPPTYDGDTAMTFTGASSQHGDAAANVTTVVDNWSIVAWVKPTASGTTRAIVSNGVNTSLNGWGLYLDTTHHAWGYAQGVGALTNADGQALGTQWYHVALVRRAGTAFIYVNGALDQTGTTSTPATPTGFTSVGADASGTGLFMDGSIAKAAVFNRALTVPQIVELYRVGRGF